MFAASNTHTFCQVAAQHPGDSSAMIGTMQSIVTRKSACPCSTPPPLSAVAATAADTEVADAVEGLCVARDCWCCGALGVGADVPDAVGVECLVTTARRVESAEAKESSSAFPWSEGW